MIESAGWWSKTIVKCTFCKCGDVIFTFLLFLRLCRLQEFLEALYFTLQTIFTPWFTPWALAHYLFNIWSRQLWMLKGVGTRNESGGFKVPLPVLNDRSDKFHQRHMIGIRCFLYYIWAWWNESCQNRDSASYSHLWSVSPTWNCK